MTTTEKPSPLTINVFKAYLNPLLKKHENGKVIVYEDLMASWDAVEAVLSENGSAPDAGSVVSIICNGFLFNIFLLECLTFSWTEGENQNDTRHTSV